MFNSPPYDLPLFSTRYVFFKTLLSEPNPSLQAYGTHASNQIHAIASLATTSGRDYVNDINDKYYQMKSYIQFVQDMAEQERNAETAFFTQQINLLKQNHEEDLAIELEEYLKGSSEDPQKFLLAINKLFQGTEQFENNVVNALTRIRSISDNMREVGEEGKQKIISDFEESYDTYIVTLEQEFSKIPKETKNTDYREIKNVNTIMAKQINDIIKNLTSNSLFIDKITELYQSKKQLTEQEIKIIIINTIIDEVTKNYGSTTKEQLINNIKNILEDMMDDASRQAEMSAEENIKTFNSNKAAKEIEVAAFNKNESLANIILELNDSSIIKIKKKYPKTSQLIDNLLDKNIQADKNKFLQAKRELTEQLRKIIINRAKRKIGTLKKNMDKQKYIEELRKKNFITPVSLSDSLTSQIRVMSLSHDALAEVATSEDVRRQIKNVIVQETPGKIIQLKADIRFSVGYIDSNTELINGDSIKTIIDDTIKLFYKDFMRDYKKIGKGATDVESAATAYMQQLLHMKEYIDQYVKNNNLPDASRKQLYESLYQTFSTSISIKDYELYNNDLGVHGGSLGPGKIPEGVIKNVTKMYEMGGITAIDANKILFAVLNCGDAMVGSDIKTHLETYLLGGAALLMFDDGFANSKNYLEQLTKQLDGFLGQRIVHIYRVSTMYIPASFILDKIAKNLQDMYFDILTDSIKPVLSQNRVTIINNVNNTAIPDAEIVESPVQRWEKVSDIAQTEIKITFSFMGGLLEILENFQSAVQKAK